MPGERARHARVHRIVCIGRDVLLRDLRLAVAARVFPDEPAHRHCGAAEEQAAVLQQQLSAVHGELKPVGAGRLAGAGHKQTRRAVCVLHIGGHVVLHLDVVPAAQAAERAQPHRHAANPLPEIEAVHRLIEQHAAALALPGRAPGAGIEIALRAEPVGHDHARAADLAQLAGGDDLLHPPVRRVRALVEHGAERPAARVRRRVQLAHLAGEHARRLFQQHVHARGKGLLRLRHMRPVRGRDQHRVDLPACIHFLRRIKHAHLPAAGQRAQRRDVFFVPRRHSRKAHLRHLLQHDLRVLQPHCAKADDAKPNLIHESALPCLRIEA